MAHRSVLQRVVKHVAAGRTGHSRCRPADAQGAPGSIFHSLERHGGSRRNDGEEEFASHLAERRSYSHGIMGTSRDSDEESKAKAAISGISGPVHQLHRNLERTMSGYSSAQTARSECIPRFLGHQVGHAASLAGAVSLSNRGWNGSSNRLFSSVPARAEGAQIAVDGELLDSSAGAVSGASDAGSAVTGLPSADALSEVAVAAADCSYPTAFIQYVIDGIHVSTGLPWWLSIVATTVAIRILVLPVMVYQMKSTARLTLLRPELEKLTNHIKESGYDPKVVEDNQVRMKALFVKHKTSPFSPILGAFIQAPLFMCFFFAIRNMAERMESFKEGGALWFTDLSTPDPFFILPVLSGAFFLLTVELGATDGMQGQPMLGKMKMVLRGLACLLVPLTAGFPKALFCYWLTANVCSIIQAVVFKQPGVKDVLGIPDVSHLAKPGELPAAPVLTFSQHPRSKGDIRITKPTKRTRSG